MRFIALILSLFITDGIAFAQKDIIAQVKDAIKTGSSKEISKLLDNTLEMTLEGKMKNYSKSQAEFLLKDFFKNNPPESFTIIHQGSSKSGIPYAIGQYLSKTGSFRVYIRIKKVKEQFFIHEMSFTKE